jgi:hypothetical protein
MTSFMGNGFQATQYRTRRNMVKPVSPVNGAAGVPAALPVGEEFYARIRRSPSHFVIPAKAGIQFFRRGGGGLELDSRLRGNDTVHLAWAAPEFLRP